MTASQPLSFVGADDEAYVRPFIDDADGKRAMHFSICTIQSRLDLARPDRLDLQYTRLMMGFLLLQPRPARLAMIGLGGGSLLRFCRRHLPATSLCVVENNPHVLALREQFMVPPDDERLHVVQADGARFMRDGADTFDVLLLDGYDAVGLPRALSTQAFFDHCARRLGPGGVLVMNLHAHAAREARILERIRRSFGGVALPVYDCERSNCIAFACHGPALRTLRLGPLQRPSGFDGEAWMSLQGDLARMLGAWREEFA